MYCHEFGDAAYVEGMAVIGGLVFEHGWVERDGEIIDPTLPVGSLVYFPGLIFDGQRGIAEALKLPCPEGCDDLPLFNRFGWGGHESADFRAARDGAFNLTRLTSTEKVRDK
jgi:hypothetical protein